MAVVQRLVKHRRFKVAFVVLFLAALLLGMVVVPLEKIHPQSTFHTYFDGIWWAVTTITSVGYGDLVPRTVLGRIIGMILEVMGVTMFGMLIGMLTVELYDEKDRFYRNRYFDRLDAIDDKLTKLESQGRFVVKKNLEETEVE
jgi:hypothetical protein